MKLVPILYKLTLVRNIDVLTVQIVRFNTASNTHHLRWRQVVRFDTRSNTYSLYGCEPIDFPFALSSRIFAPPAPHSASKVSQLRFHLWPRASQSPSTDPPPLHPASTLHYGLQSVSKFSFLLLDKYSIKAYLSERVQKLHIHMLPRLALPS